MNPLKKIITALTLSTIGFAFSASAGPIITAWDWQVDSAFTAYTPASAVTSSLTNAELGAPSKLSWGNNNSSLQITGGDNGKFTGTNLANGALALTSILTHNNFVISGTTLATAKLSTKLQLDPYPQVGDFDIMPPALVFDINFLETNNDSSCEVASPKPCNDIFVINASDFNQQFILDDYTYNVELLVSGLGMLTDAACQAADANIGCSGFTTVEDLSNSFDVNMRITALSDPRIDTEQVAEPSSILLMSLALFGLVGGIRTKHS